jgi:hypothetical protein
MNASKWGNRIGFVVGNIVWYSTAIAGMAYSNVYAFNTFKFFTWFLVIMWTIIFLGTALDDKHIPMEERGFPGIISSLTDITLALIVAAFGHWFYAALIVYQQFCEVGVYHKPSERTKE